MLGNKNTTKKEKYLRYQDVMAIIHKYDNRTFQNYQEALEDDGYEDDIHELETLIEVINEIKDDVIHLTRYEE